MVNDPYTALSPATDMALLTFPPVAKPLKKLEPYTTRVSCKSTVSSSSYSFSLIKSINKKMKKNTLSHSLDS